MGFDDEVLEDIVDGETWICQGDCNELFEGPEELAYIADRGPVCQDCGFE